MPSKPVVLLALLVLATAAPGSTVYKWVEPDGSVTFSSTPPPDGQEAETIEEVPVAPPPSEADRENAERRLRAMQDLAAEMERERKARRAASRPPRVTPLPPTAPPPSGVVEPADDRLVFDDWWTGPARPVGLEGAAVEPVPPERPFFTPAPVPAFH